MTGTENTPRLAMTLDVKRINPDRLEIRAYLPDRRKVILCLHGERYVVDGDQLISAVLETSIRHDA